MSDTPPKTLKRQDVERITHEILGRQLRLMVGLGALLLVIGFVVGQFTGASLARRNTERLETQLDQMEQVLAGLESQIDERRTQHSELEQMFSRVEALRTREIENDQIAFQAMIGDFETVRTATHADLDEFDVSRRTVPTDQVRTMVDRFVAEQVNSVERLLSSSARRLGQQPEESNPSATAAAPDMRTPAPSSAPTESGRTDASAPRTQQLAAPLACRPKNMKLVQSNPVRTAVSEARYLTPPRTGGYLYFSPSQPRRIDPTRLSESDTIPLPPR